MDLLITLKSFLRALIPKQNFKVNIFIIGAQKSGTSALHSYMLNHREIIGGKVKEINYFNHKEKYAKGDNWYHNQFVKPLFYKPKKYFIDSTPQYITDENVAEMIFQYNPNAHIIVLLRNPVERAYSAWNMYKQFSEFTDVNRKKLADRHASLQNRKLFYNFITTNPFPSFEDFAEKELKNIDTYPRILKKGIYVEQLIPYYKLFPKNKITIIESKDFKQNKLEYLNLIFDKLELSNIQDLTLEDVHKREYVSKMKLETKNKLIEFYKPYNEKLSELTGLKFNWS